MVHWIQAREAFVTDRPNVRFFALDRTQFMLDKAWVSLDCICQRTPIDHMPVRQCRWAPHHCGDDYWYVNDSQRLQNLLRRHDLTRHHGESLVVTNAAKSVMAFAVGPAEAPKRVAVVGNVFDLKRHVLAAPDDTQPEWWLFDATPVDPFHGRSDAKAWKTKWDGQIERGEEPSWN